MTPLDRTLALDRWKHGPVLIAEDLDLDVAWPNQLTLEIHRRLAECGAGLGPGPRDGLMTGLARRGLSVRMVRTGLELTALAIGFVLGGSVGVGTVAYALAIGPLVQWALPRLTVTAALEGERRESRAVRT